MWTQRPPLRTEFQLNLHKSFGDIKNHKMKRNKQTMVILVLCSEIMHKYTCNKTHSGTKGSWSAA